MKILKPIYTILAVVGAALAGNWIGAQIHFLLTGKPAHGIIFRYTDERGKTYTNVPVSTNFYPAIAASFFGRPPWLFAFLGGVIASLLMGDRFQRIMMKSIVARFEIVQTKLEHLG